MKVYFDFEIHSKYSRACSLQLTIPNIAKWAERKGVNVIGTGDFTHPRWLEEIKENLKEEGSGLLSLKDGSSKTKFILSCEISSIYSHNGKTRRIHNIVLAPSISDVEKIISKLQEKGAKLGSDGRPIVGIPSKELLRLILEVSEECMLIPAHVWTPYFGLFGSMSGYDSVEECFEDLSKYIYALETGLSADPEMFWRISKFDRFTLVSCSDPHSLSRIGRECNLFELAENELSYTELTRIIKEKDTTKFTSTLEYWPEEGRYHYDGHADCKVSLHPSQTKKHKGICPACGKKITIGVLSRAEELSDREAGYRPKVFVPGKHFVVLDEIIAAGLGKGAASKKVQNEYMGITDKYNEFKILFDLDESELNQIAGNEITEAILKMRAGQVEIEPGYDGVYGKIKLFDIQKIQENPTLF